MLDQNNQKKSGFLTLPIIRDLLVILLIFIIVWRLINTDTQFDFSQFSFSDLLALILALFSISLSVAFYFKAGDTSNQFYDNSYKFTKEMSEILGRIEAGFGQKLDYLHEGYSGLSQKIDRSYGIPNSVEVKKGEQEIKNRENELKQIIDDFANNAQIDATQKAKLIEDLATANDELQQARAELRRLKRSDKMSISERHARDNLLNYIAHTIQNYNPDIKDFSLNNLQNAFLEVKHHLHQDAFRDLEFFNLTNSDGELNKMAMLRIRNILQNM